jgi:hypothetical protein
VQELNHAEQLVTARIARLAVGATVRYRIVATNETGTATGPERTYVVRAPGGSAYRAAILSTPGVLGYWRLGEAAGPAAANETGGDAGVYSAQGVTLSQPGVLAGDADTSVAFDGVAGEKTATANPLPIDGDATLEGWFDWRDGVAVMRDHTTSGGWILVYDRNDSTDSMGTRIAGATYTTDLPVTSFQNGWHHFVATKRGGEVNLYVDAKRVPLRLTSPGTAAASVGAWHVMRNGRTGNAFTRGGADEIAVYTSALTPGDIQRHYQLGR